MDRFDDVPLGTKNGWYPHSVARRSAVHNGVLDTEEVMIVGKALFQPDVLEASVARIQLGGKRTLRAAYVEGLY